MNSRPAVMALLSLGLAAPAFPAIIGTNVPASPLTAARVAPLPVWKAYFEHSQRQRQADQDFFRAELKAHALKDSALPPAAHSAGNLPLRHRAEWYGGAAAQRLADNLVTFQTPAGGWSKNTDYTRHSRAPGEMFGAENGSLHLGTNDFDAPEDPHWSYVGTFDNDATTTELRFLARTIAVTNNPAWQKSFLRGLEYIFAAQYPNGGWPQVWPLQGGYHDNITFNDDAMLHVLALLQDVAESPREFSFVPETFRAQAAASFRRGLACLLAAQVVVEGRRLAWAQQNDALTLQPAPGRNYEMPALASSESAAIALFLMNQPHPDAHEDAAIQAVCVWFQKTKIEGWAYENTGTAGRTLVAAPGAAPLWARFYEIGTDRPIFGDRDKTIHDEVNDLSRERRNGYGWYREAGRSVLERYAQWVNDHP